jgi:protein involved in polysaccharide export with SLBB domain
MLALPGCSPFRTGVPARDVRPNFFDAPRSGKEPINFTRLRREPPPVYLLGPGDTLGIFVEGVLGRRDEPPPVHFPEYGDMPPSIGFPLPIREDGTLSLPLIPPLPLTGLTIAQAEHEIRKTYIDDLRIVQPGARIIVTLMKPRTYSVLVVREDSVFSSLGLATPNAASRAGAGFEPERHGMTQQVQLRAYENDVLHALSATGGLPGIDAKNEVVILRGAANNPQAQEQYQRALQDPLTRQQLFASRNVIRIPLRLSPHEPPVTLSSEDITLNAGDVVFVETRSAEVFYTGGLLQGHQMPIPRDYDLDVLGAIAMSGGSIAAGAGSNALSGAARGGSGIGSIFPPTRVVVLRTINGRTEAIKLNMQTALLDPRERILIQPNDLIVLEYTEFELVMNILLNNLSLNVDVNQLLAR